MMTRLTRAAAATATLLALAACGEDAKPAAAPAPSPTVAPTSVAPAATLAAVASPLTRGQLFTFDNGGMTTTVLQYKQPVGEGPDLKKGEVLGGVEVKTCVLAHADAPQEVSVGAWSLEWADGTTNNTKWSGVVSSEYPFEGKTLNPGKCVKGWIVFTVPATSKPTVAVYEGQANKGRPTEWKLS